MEKEILEIYRNIKHNILSFQPILIKKNVLNLGLTKLREVKSINSSIYMNSNNYGIPKFIIHKKSVSSIINPKDKANFEHFTNLQFPILPSKKASSQFVGRKINCKSKMNYCNKPIQINEFQSQYDWKIDSEKDSFFNTSKVSTKNKNKVYKGLCKNISGNDLFKAKNKWLKIQNENLSIGKKIMSINDKIIEKMKNKPQKENNKMKISKDLEKITSSNTFGIKNKITRNNSIEIIDSKKDYNKLLLNSQNFLEYLMHPNSSKKVSIIQSSRLSPLIIQSKDDKNKIKQNEIENELEIQEEGIKGKKFPRKESIEFLQGSCEYRKINRTTTTIQLMKIINSKKFKVILLVFYWFWKQ